jgi:hypothetical protein
MTWLSFTLYSLAVFRLSLMISKEDGPAWIFRSMRSLVSRKAPKSTHLDEGIKCQWCASIWMAALFVACRHFFINSYFFQLSVILLALSGAAIVINQAFTKGEK